MHTGGPWFGDWVFINLVPSLLWALRTLWNLPPVQVLWKLHPVQFAYSMTLVSYGVFFQVRHGCHACMRFCMHACINYSPFHEQPADRSRQMMPPL